MLQDCSVAGFGESALQLVSGTVVFVARLRQVTDRVWIPPPQLAEHRPNEPLTQTNAGVGDGDGDAVGKD